ncbi:50S ribosomal protein L33 [Paenibacillus puerhi]|uniref:50S ribosomal protein L33 n=1 Tax=Paenibacillus puerhi TaxID=2692622 RepID=UPI0013593749|nr:50S ribosomal protein L33 [Paenibacillus puerhi]
MHKAIRKQEVAKLVGKSIYAVNKDGSVVRGKLVKVSDGKLYVSVRSKGKSVRTSAVIPLVLFDLLAIGTLPFAGFGFGAPGFGFGGFGGFW